MRRVSVVARVQLSLPPVEELESAGAIRDFVAEIIGPAAVGVDVVEMLMEFFGE